MKRLAEFNVTLSTGGIFYAAWPRDADGREVSAAGAMLGELTRWWGERLDQQAAGNAEYDSWLPVNPSGAPAWVKLSDEIEASPPQGGAGVQASTEGAE